ncbi:MAG: HD domain-containing protein [Phycisphaerales bacterium]|nr:HD domain-containing protein [Phycisphaerales bacterium]
MSTNQMALENWNLVTTAAAMSAQAHEGQQRHDGSPYVQHPARVAVLLARAGADPRLIAAGFLHDVIEDSTVDWDEIAEALGGDVANWVAVMTKDMRLPEEIREARYRKQLEAGPWQGRAVKLADQIDNYTNASGAAIEKVRPKAQWALEISAGDDEPLILCLRAQLEEALTL